MTDVVSSATTEHDLSWQDLGFDPVRGPAGRGTLADVLDASLPLLPEPRAAAAARRWASDLLGASVGVDTRDSVELVLTELVQNAVFHASTPMVVRLRVAGDRVVVTVTDGSPVLPSSGLTHAEAMSGRGLLMVAAVAATWGAEPRPGGKVVWASIPERPGTDGETDVGADVGADVDDLIARWPTGTRTPLQQGDRAPLVVPGLPTATMLAVKTHNDDVFRELTLLAMGGDAYRPGPAAEVAGLARRARSVLATFADGRQQVRNQVLDAIHAGRPTFDLALAVDDEVGSVLGDYLDILEQADGLAARGLLLSRPPDPEVLAVRRHYLGSLIALSSRQP